MPVSAADDLYMKYSKVINHDPDSALRIAKKLYHISSESTDMRGISMAFMQFGYIAAMKGKTDSAKLFYKKALDIRKKNHLKEEAVSTYYQLSVLYNDLGIKDSAFYFLYEALGWNDSAPDKNYSGLIYIYLGRLYMDHNEPAEAIKSLKKGASFTEQFKDTFGIFQAYTELGNFYYQQNRFDSALWYFRQCEILAKQSIEETKLADAYNNLALCYSATRNTGQAIYYYGKALGTYIKLDSKSDISLAYLNLGSLYLDAHETDSSLYYLERAKSISRQTGDADILLKSLKYLADAYAAKGNFIKAFDYRVQFGSLNDSLMNNEKIKQIADMQTRYETEKKEQQIVLLDEKSKTRSAQRNFFIAGSAILLLLLLTLGYYFLQKQKVAKKNEEIARQKIASLLNEQEIKSYNAMIEGQEEERKRLAEDLHDRIGSMLSTVKLLFGALENKVGQYQDENKKQFENVNQLLDEAVAEVRKVSHDLSTGMVMNFGLVTALQELCSSIEDSGLIHCKLLAYGMNERLDTQTEIGIYRMVQELISNILKHAKASNIIIQLNRGETSLNITVEDDGIGFDTANRKPGGGIGLKNLEARAAKLGGIYHVDSSPGAGTISIIEVPIQNDII
jgi:signal transduction histidine kinase